MIDSLFAADPSLAWHGESLSTLRAEPAQADGDFTAFVVDHPERPVALACPVAGTIDHRIGKASDPQGRVGLVLHVSLGFRPPSDPLLELAL
ncbi:hypothetical protein GCM10010104_47000 [Streptomyces indiaensis]|uniref:Uncharacterized protein n=1 Tax=Streptomyces indiaensis TaxID=284033 RepID=A0ABP5QYV0_9ACTN